MTNREAHKLAKKAMLRAKMDKMERAYAHKCVHAHRLGGGFDQWQLVEADRRLIKAGFNAACVCREELRRDWMEQPD